MQRKNFDAKLADRQPPNFTVAGQDFDCRPRIAMPTFEKLMKLLTSDTSSMSELEAAGKFITTCLRRKDRERFNEVLHNEGADSEDGDDTDDDNIIDPGQLNDIVDYLMEYHTGKLGESQPSSSPGESLTQGSRNVVSLNPRTIPA